MIIYHGSDTSIEQPEILESNRYLDFGVGFYTTRNKEQAERWARKVCLRNDSLNPIISVYNCNFVELKKELNVIDFAYADESWLDFVVANRRGKIVTKKYDVVDGPVADDNVYLTIKLFEDGVFDKVETLKRLKIEKLFNQISFHTEVSLRYCSFNHSHKLHRITNG
ncbi:MAG: DUF3990 domain-containing protein [Spirochaetales bacterium]|nr:DUF3990 domain-containing protein [Spirochaetales bacterium]